MQNRGTLLLLLLLAIVIALPVHASTPESADQAPELRVDAERLEKRILELARFGSNPEGGVSRVAFSDADVQGREYILSLMAEAGLQVRIDAAGNILGHRAGREPQLAPILFGSHIDSVPHGGNYDGDVGVIAAIECAQVLEEAGVKTQHPLEVVVFSDEEGGLVGSRAMIGDLPPEALDLIGHSGLTTREGIRKLGGDPDRIHEAARSRGQVTAFLELHIEQGGILDSREIQIGIVEGIVGIKWWEIVLEGVANHAGTTPMDQRQDALLAAADLITAVNRVVTARPGSQVGTVGQIRAEPGAPNVIPGRVVMSLEIRDLSMEKIETLFQAIRGEADRIAERSNIEILFTPLDVTAVATPTDPRIRQYIEASAQQLGLSFLSMPSGAGHDAQDLARITPTGMIFVPSVDGISHSPDEYTRPEDLANGANVLLHTILRIDGAEMGGGARP
jgi:N-carbamoyl-L-amino-acid hydrolase